MKFMHLKDFEPEGEEEKDDKIKTKIVAWQKK